MQYQKTKFMLAARCLPCVYSHLAFLQNLFKSW